MPNCALATATRSARPADRRLSIAPQQAFSHFTVCVMPQPRVGLYATSTMVGCRSAKARRRGHAGAVVCALSLFVALVAGSALRPHYTTNALPEPGAWIHRVEHVQHAFKPVQPISATAALIALRARGNSHPVPFARKPFSYVWMTQDVPSNWVPLSPFSDRWTSPKSVVSAQNQPRDALCAAFAKDPDSRHTSTLFCIIRC